VQVQQGRRTCAVRRGDRSELRNRYRDQLERQNSASHLVPHPDSRRQWRHRCDRSVCATIKDASDRASSSSRTSIPRAGMWASLARVQGRRTLASHRRRGLPRAWHDHREGAVRFHNRWLRAGTSAADAPGKIAACGTTTGTVGSTTQLSGQASIDRRLNGRR